MKKLLKSLTLMLSVIVIGGMLASCGGVEASSLYGEWSDNEDNTAVLCFYDDGSYAYTWENEDVGELYWTGTYTVTSGKIMVTDDDYPEDAAVSSSVSINGNKLTIGYDSIIGGSYTKK